MIDLVKKEIYISRNYFAFILLFPLLSFYFSVLVSLNESLVSISFTVIILLSTSLIQNSISKEDEKNKTKILMVCLPIERSKDIKSKYLVSALIPIIFSILFYLYILFIENTKGSGSWQFGRMGISLEYEMIFLASSISLIYLGLTKPIPYCESKLIKALGAIPNILLFPLFMYSPALVMLANKTNFIENKLKFNVSKLSIIIFLISIFIYLASMKISIKLYNKKEF